MTRIFVFGSNLAGRHGAGSAKWAHRLYGAQYGVGEGRQGNSYAIPTKDHQLHTLGLGAINQHVVRFLVYAITHPDDEFDVVAIGCGLAGYRPEQIAPMFVGATTNVILPDVFDLILQRT